MKKMNRKVISLILAMLMVLTSAAVGMVVFADDTTSSHDCNTQGHDYVATFGGYADADGNKLTDDQVNEDYKYTDGDGNLVSARPYHYYECQYCGVHKKDSDGNEIDVFCKKAGGWQHDENDCTHYIGCESECGLKEHESICQDKELNYTDSTGTKTTDGLCDVCGAELDHRYQKSGSVSPTCTSAGTETYTCINCGKSFTLTTAAALGHHWPSSDDSKYFEVEWDTENYNWCKITFECEFGCGATMSYTAYANAGNEENFIEKTEDTPATCATAGGTVYTATFNIKDIKINGWEEHTNTDGTYIYTTSISTGTIPATGEHTYGEYTITKAATCTEAGEKTATCTVCGNTVTETIEATGHTYELVEGKEATCTTAGYGTQKCSVCGDTITSEIPATGHTVKSYVEAPTCTDAGIAVCANCGEEFAVSAKGHADTDYDGICDVCGEEIGYADVDQDIRISIDTPSTKVIPYGHSLVLTAKSNKEIPLGYSVSWSVIDSDSSVELSVSDDGMTCEVKSVSAGTATIMVELCDASGNTVTFANSRTVSDTLTVKTTDNIWQRIISFIKTIFFITKKIY